jgi:hypothetical protein
VPEEELDLFEVATALPAELGAGPAQVMRSELLDSNLLGRLLDYGPNRPVAQTLADFAALRDRSQQSALLKARGSDPGVDSLLDPDGDRTVRIRLPFPSRSANTQRPSRNWMVSTSRVASSRRRRAQPTSSARIT